MSYADRFLYDEQREPARRAERRSLVVLTPPEIEPLELERAKKHLRVENADDDAEIALLIAAVRDACEGFTGRAIGVTRYELSLDAFPASGEIGLERPPLVEVETVEYYDLDGTRQTLDPARYYTVRGPCRSRLMRAPLTVWPEVQADRAGVVIVTYKAGYADAQGAPAPALVPPKLRQAMLMWLGSLYENHEAVNVGNIVNEIPLGVRDLLELETVPRV